MEIDLQGDPELAADDRDMPPLVFATPADALAAFLRAASFARARAARYEEAPA